MAELSVQQIQQRLTCPVCLDRYKQPKLLPCQHSFCLAPCLVNLVERQTRTIKCPECRVVHHIPPSGVDAFPNNITILRFLDLDLSNIERLNETISNENCAGQCGQKHANFFKCLDCDKSFCVNCKQSHVVQLRNEITQSVYNLRRNLPKLSQNVGNYEQKKTSISQNFESLKREISSAIEKIIGDLRDRERCLVAEAEVYMQSQIRTIGLENENAEIELATVSSFCDSAEATLNREDPENDNNIAVLKKQCLNFLSQTNNLTELAGDINKLILAVPNINDFSNFIRNFGTLTVANRMIDANSSLARTVPQQNYNSQNYFNQNNQPRHDYFSFSQPQQNNSNQSVTRNRNERPIMGGGSGGGGGGGGSGGSSAAVGNLISNRQRAVPSPVGFNVNITNTNPNNDRSTRTNPSQAGEDVNRSVVRSNTFVIESNQEEPPRQQTRTVDITEFYNVQRRPRAKTPMTFNIMLDETNIDFDPSSNTSRVEDSNNGTGNGVTIWQTPSQPRINYASKKKPKLVIGKPGKEYGEFIWPLDVAVNSFNNQILVADSNNHRIQVFEPDGKFVRSFGRQGNREGQFDCIDGIFVDSMSNIYVVDRLNHRIQIFDRYFRFVRTIGSGPGNAPGKLNYPWGIAVNRISEIFVCDKENDRLCVFHQSGRFLRSFGTHGSADGQFDKPYFVHITRDNKVLVSDSSNHRIQAFDSNGFFLFKIGREGTNPGEFKNPRGITTDSEGFILVADSGNSRIQVFKGDGSYLTCFGSSGSEPGKLKGVEGITVNKNGDIIICDKENNRIQIF